MEVHRTILKMSLGSVRLLAPWHHNQCSFASSRSVLQPALALVLAVIQFAIMLRFRHVES